MVVMVVVVMPTPAATAELVLVRHAAVVKDGAAIAVPAHIDALTIDGAAASAAVMPEATLTAVIPRLSILRSDDGKTGGNGQKGEEFFHNRWGCVGDF